MILEFWVANFRSIRHKQHFSLLASASQSKSGNTIQRVLASGEVVHLLKTAGVYGANSFGKSNLLRAIFALHQLIQTSADNKIGDLIGQYDPFLLDTDSRYIPTELEISFIGTDQQKYHYKVIFDAQEVHYESLEYFPEKKKQTIFKRQRQPDQLVHHAKLGKHFGRKEVALYRNQLFLSKVGKDIPHPFLVHVFLYFNRMDIWNVTDVRRLSLLRQVILQDLKQQEDTVFFDRLNQLMRLTDTKIEQLVFIQQPETPIPPQLPEALQHKLQTTNERVFARHRVYDAQHRACGTHDLPLSEESTGTNHLLALGGLILQKLTHGGVMIMDEMDTSMHPLLSRYLVQLFQHPLANRGNAQLIFTSHEVNILDKNNMRADQIWFADKNTYGETEIYSAQDFQHVREDIPFDKWYMAGKFGAIPQMNETEIAALFAAPVDAHACLSLDI